MADANSAGRFQSLLRRVIPSTAQGRVLALLALVMAVWGLVDVQRRAKVLEGHPRVHKTDFTVYTEAGAAFFDGRDPYAVANPRGWKYLYPPLFAMTMAPLHPLPLRVQVLVWFALSVWMTWGCFKECLRILRAAIPGPAWPGSLYAGPMWIVWLAVAAAALPALNCLQRGQVSIFKAYLLLLGFRLLIESRRPLSAFVGGIVLALPIVLKVTPLVPVGVILLQQVIPLVRRPRAADANVPRALASPAGVICGLMLGVFIVPTALIGWQANWRHLDTWWNSIALHSETNGGDEFSGDNYSYRNQSLANAVQHVGNFVDHVFYNGKDDKEIDELHGSGSGLIMDTPLVHRLLFGVRFAAGLLLLAAGVRLGMAGEKLDQAAGFGLACAAMFVVFTIARVHYFVLCLPAVALVGNWLLHHGSRSRALYFCAAPAILIFLHYTVMGVAGRFGVLGLGITAWYVAAAIVICREAGRPPVAGSIDVAPAIERRAA